jgi:flagellar motor component MotA
MSEDTPKQERTNPRWDVVNELYDYVDKGIVDIGEKHKMNFVEISMALIMIEKKIRYEEFRAMLDFNLEQMQEQQKEQQVSDNMYR